MKNLSNKLLNIPIYCKQKKKQQLKKHYDKKGLNKNPDKTSKS